MAKGFPKNHSGEQDDDTFDTSEAARTKAAAKMAAGGGGKGNFAKDQLKSIVERIERLESEKSDLTADIREVYAEAGGNGFDKKIIRKVVRIRKQDATERSTEEEMTDLYLSALNSGV